MYEKKKSKFIAFILFTDVYDTDIGTTIAKSLSGRGRDKQRNFPFKTSQEKKHIPLSINIAIKRSRFGRVIKDIRNPIRKPE